MIALALGLGTLAHGYELDGVWKLESDNAGEQVKAKIAKADVSIPFIGAAVKGILKRATSPCGEIEIHLQGPSGAVRCDDQVPAEGPLDGHTFEFRGRDGRKLKVSLRRDGDMQLVQVFRGKAGVRTNQMHLHDDRLHVEVIIRSGVLSAPLHYDLFYVRKAAI